MAHGDRRAEGQYLTSVEVTILSGQTAAVDGVGLQGKALVAIELPDTFTGTALTFESCSDGTNYRAVHDNGTPLSITVAQDSYSVVDPSKWFGIDMLKVVSGSAEGGDRTLKLFLREVT